MEGVKVAGYGQKAGQTKFDLTMTVAEVGGQIRGGVEYSLELFEQQTITRMIGHFKQILQSAIAKPDCAIQEIEMMSEKETAQILHQWNETARLYDTHLSIVDMFERVTQATGQATAVVFEDEAITYDELNSRANKLAWYLMSTGVVAEQKVGLMMSRSIQMVVSVLGILKAGAAYLPLDSSYPPQRVNYMVEDAAIALILTDSRFEAVLEATPTQILNLDELCNDISAYSGVNPGVEIAADNLAYVIYTSGSTGIPKGVMGLQKATMNRLNWMWEQFAFQADERCCQKTALGFVDSVGEVFGGLLRGVVTVLIAEEVVRDTQKFAQEITRQEVTRLVMVPSQIRAMIEMGKGVGKTLENLRVCVSSGEVLNEELSRRIKEVMGKTTLLNLYGSTEVGADATWHEIKEARGKKAVAIGTGIANTEVYVLDARMEIVPIGVAGELYIGGDGLARGYLNRPELTAEKFMPNPYGKEAGQRMYRTGDICRWNADGKIDYIARSDFQVKVRGYRIELGEIEAVLEKEARVKQAVVVLKQDAADKRLIAYVVMQEAVEVSGHELRSYLKSKLPDYMLPSLIVMLDHLPLNSSGKIDRSALALAPLSRDASPLLYQQPRSPIEELLEAIWCDVLAVTSVGVTENFFDIGGHSLLATQVMSRISSSVGADIPLRKIFEGPTIEDLASRVAQELRKADRIDAPQITKLPRAEGMSLPLSFAQQRLWFIDQLLPDSGAYNISSAFRLSGSLNAHALELSFNRILLRHEVLRTRFLQLDGHPVQIIDPVLSIKLALIDLQPLSDHQQQLALKLAASQVASNGFDLSAGPLIRVCLVRCSLHEHVLLLTLHHIVTDGWSTSILMSELNHFYHGYLSGEPLPLQELDIQYADYAAWQRDWLKGDILHLQLQYWRQQLLGMQTVLEIPTDRLRPPTHSLRRSWQSMSIPLETSSSFISHTSAQAATLYMSMLAAFAVVLWRNTGLTDISIGSPVANRKRGDLEKLIGCFVNTVVMRVQIDEEASFSDLVTSVREVALGAYAHEETPFEKVVEMMQPERSMNRAPLVQVTLTMQNAPRGKLVIGDREVTGMRAASGAGAAAAMEYDLSLIVGEAEKTIAGILIYNEDLYEAQTISRLVNQMQRVIETVTRAWDSKLLSLDLISQQERSQILAASNPTTTLDVINRTIAEVFEQEAENRRSAIALQCGQEAITYQQLNTKANQLGNYLRELGVGPEVMVGIMMDRGIEMIVSMLAILKAGGAYVPIDEQYPMERIAFQIEDAAIGIVVTKKEYAGKVPALMVQVVEVDEQCDEIGNRDEQNLEVEIAADNLAYVIYTSGSTGNPKGVEIQHRSVIRLVKGAGYVNLDEQETLLQASTLSFDAATFEIWGALLNGAKLVVLQSRLATGHELSTIIAEQAVSTLWLTSSLYNAIADERVEYLQGVKQLLVGGEALSVRHIREGVRRLKGLSMINGYGPTEGTTFTCCHQIGEADVEEGRLRVAIGTGITNTFVYVLDKWMEIVPIGVAGELYIAGDGLARGYLNRPEITAEKFMPNPYGKEAGERLYRTGDICRYNNEGSIEYLARSDYQVKVRGYRIELGEIEAVLEKEASVKQAVVVVKQDAADKRLIAYVVADEAVEVTSDELRSFLKSRLPDYMIPAGIIVLAQMPLTANGKVDRPGLAQRDWVIQLTEQYVEASTPQEKALAEVWKEVLGAQRVGIKENYFELGGDSIRGIRVVAKARDRGVRVSIQDLFQYPTIEELAMQAGEVIQQAQEHRKEFTLISEHDRRKIPEGVEDAYPLSRIQAGMVFHSQYNEGSAVYHDIISYRIKGEYEEAAMRRSIERLIQRHEMLRTGMELDGYSEPLQLVYERVEAPLEMQDISNRSEAEQEEEVERWIEQEKREGFEWGKAPLMRIKVTRRGKEDYQLSISFHHAILDGWSFASLLVELYQEYWEEMGRKGGRRCEKPRSKYREYVRAEREAIQSEEEKKYWEEMLEGARETKIGIKGKQSERRIRHMAKGINSEVVDKIKKIAREMEVPVKSVLLGAHMRVMSVVQGKMMW